MKYMPLNFWILTMWMLSLNTVLAAEGIYRVKQEYRYGALDFNHAIPEHRARLQLEQEFGKGFLFFRLDACTTPGDLAFMTDLPKFKCQHFNHSESQFSIYKEGEGFCEKSVSWNCQPFVPGEKFNIELREKFPNWHDSKEKFLQSETYKNTVGKMNFEMRQRLTPYFKSCLKHGGAIKRQGFARNPETVSCFPSHKQVSTMECWISNVISCH